MYSSGSLLAIFPQASNSVMSFYLKWLWAGHRDRDERIEGHLLSFTARAELVKDKLAGCCWVQWVLCRQMGQQRKLVLISTYFPLLWMSTYAQWVYHSTEPRCRRISLRFCVPNLNTELTGNKTQAVTARLFYEKPSKKPIKYSVTYQSSAMLIHDFYILSNKSSLN